MLARKGLKQYLESTQKTFLIFPFNKKAIVISKKNDDFIYY